MWDALGDLAATLEAMADGTCLPRFYLSSLDPGVGKTQTVSHFIRALLASEIHAEVAVLVCVSRLDEIATLATKMGLPEGTYAVFTRDETLNQLGTTPGGARVLFTTQQMVESRCNGKPFSDAAVFHYRGRPRQVRIWDESILPGQTLTLNRDDIGFLFRPVRGSYPALTQDLDKLFAILADVQDKAFFDVPDLAGKHGVGINDVLKLLDGYPQHQQVAASALWFLLGKRVVARRDGHLGNTLLDYRETLPEDLAPVAVLDASGRVRGTYREWEQSRGSLVRLRSAVKSYGQLTVNVWQTSGGKSAFWKNGDALTDGIASTINSKSTEEWLVVCHQPKAGGFDVERSVRDLLKGDQGRIHFITWGNHHATNRYANVPNVILAGTLFYRPSYYESLGRLCAGLSADDGHYPSGSLESIVQGEHAHLVLQALCRGSVRQCDGNQCRPCNAYVIASVRSGIPEAIRRIFPGCKVKRWQPVARALSGKVKDSVDFIADWFEWKSDYVSFSEVRKAIGMADSANFKNRIRSHPDFQEALASMSAVEHGNGQYPRGFLRVSNLGSYYGFTEEEPAAAHQGDF